jgi:hypothetical protein
MIFGTGIGPDSTGSVLDPDPGRPEPSPEKVKKMEKFYV